MFHSVKSYIAERRAGVSKISAVAGGLYIARGYIHDRLEEVKHKLEEERAARETLNRRFTQTQEDVSFTVLALIQTLADHILTNMDVEGLTQELQNRSKARHAVRRRQERPPSSLASSIDIVQERDAQSDMGSAVVSIASLSNEDGNLDMVASVTTSVTEDSSAVGSTPSDTGMSDSMISDTSATRTTAELWNDVKILTLTRTLTTLYSTTLLSLLTAIQLTLLARSKYVQSVVQLERDERMQATFVAQFSISNMLLGSDSFEKLLSGDMSDMLGGDEDNEADVEPITQEVEARFLTMSWWILHVGWKDVGERVRRGVEEVFDGVSLKSKLAAIDLHRLVGDVRRRVEHEVTFEGTERRINFLSSLLPPTPETVQHVLTQGGFPSGLSPCLEPLEFDDLSSSQLSSLSAAMPPQTLHSNVQLHPYTQPPAFSALLDETRSIIASADFAHALEVCLDRATEILFANLEKNVFVASEQPVGSAGGEAVRIRLAGLLPGLARWSQLAMRGLPNELIDNLLEMREAVCMSAIIFGKFEDMLRL